MNEVLKIYTSEFKPVKFKNIKIGEVFAFYGCWNICEKISDSKLIIIETNWTGKYCHDIFDVEYTYEQYWNCCDFTDRIKSVKDRSYIPGLKENSCYRIPKKIQKLWMS